MKRAFGTAMGKALPLLIAATLMAAAAPAEVYQIGDTVADFTLPDLDGVPVSLYDYFGDIVVLNFFTTWCPGCNEEAEGLENEIWQVYRERGLTVLAVDIAEPPILVAGWAAANDVTYQILSAPDWELYTDYGPGVIPYNAVIDRTMTLRYSQIGFDQLAIVEMIETILAEDTTAVELMGSWGQIKALYP